MSALGALIGLLLAIVLIIKKVSPVYSLILGALVGGIAGGITLPDTVALMVSGVKDVTPAILRILTAGVLSGVLVKTGAAASISNTLVRKLGERHVYLAVALATMLLTAIGVFIDVAVITVAPIALTLGYKLSIPKSSLLLIMIGGGKCGNIISPNPNTIIAAENFNAALPSVMAVNLIPAIVGLLFTVYIISRFMPKKQEYVTLAETENKETGLPSFAASIAGPAITILLLAMRPLFGIEIDPLIALPAGGLAGILAMRKLSLLKESLAYGLEKMSVVAVLLIGTGTIAGIIKASSIKDVMLGMLADTQMGETLIAPISGVLMSAATASTTAGATIASSSFAETILAAGISAVWGAAMINSGATVLDHLPHGSFFHATAGVTNVKINDRLKLIPYETAIGLVLAAGSVISYLIFNS
ncbi:MAG: GntP family permease [Tannerellaceae bacterium]|jgi:GntP family gluconate:H+ symporter|nr:GntP family permease [Tannerellaceae bacterium]